MFEHRLGGLALRICAPRFVGFLDCGLKTKLAFCIGNGSKKALRVKLRCVSGLTLPFETTADVPPMSEVVVEEAIFSPRFLAVNGEVRTMRIDACLPEYGIGATAKVCVLPFDFWEGTEGDAKRLAAFVRPSAAACEEVCGELGAKEKYGDAASVRAAFSSLVARLSRRMHVFSSSLEGPCSVWPPVSGNASELEAAVFACSCLERMGYNPVLAVGREHAAFGIWLFDGALCEPVGRDVSAIRTYLTAGAGNLAFCPADALNGCSAGAAEANFLRGLDRGDYTQFVDIRRCRGILPCPARAKEGQKGQTFSFSDWENGLLDFTARNPLLNFTGKQAISLVCKGADELLQKLSPPITFNLLTEEQDGETPSPLLTEEQVDETPSLRLSGDVREIALLYRRDRAKEVSHGLSVAIGFLRYFEKRGKQARRAPVMLVPVELTPSGEGYTLSVRGDPSPNVTLLEYLRQTFHLTPAREGLDGVREMIKDMPGWEVCEEACIAAFSFRRSALRNDLMGHRAQFERNRTVRALLGEGFEEVPALPAEDETSPLDVMLPLPADSTQFRAVALAARGGSFVLHGPPGTGKSQTIANIIADSLFRGKKVLFVSEKKAARDVLLRRLEEAGIGEFCLGLSAETSNAAISEQILHTLSFTAREQDLSECAAEYGRLRAREAERTEALFRRRKAGFSVHEGILCALERAGVPDLPDEGDLFYETLTAEKYARCRAEVLRAAAAAKGCDPLRSPFAGLEFTQYTADLRDRLYCAAGSLQAACRHAADMLNLALPFLRHSTEKLSLRETAALSALFRRIAGGTYDVYFAGTADLPALLHADERLCALLPYYFRHFSALTDCDLEGEWELEEWRLRQDMRAAVRRLSRVAVGEFSEEDAPKYLGTLFEINSAIGVLKREGVPCFDRAGRFLRRKYDEFFEPLRALHGECGSLFTDFDPSAFDGMCMRVAKSGTYFVFLRAAEALDGAAAMARECFGDAVEGGLEEIGRRAGELIEGIDGLAAWCDFRDRIRTLRSLGLYGVAAEAERGEREPRQLLSMFEKNVCRRLLDLYISSDPALSLPSCEMELKESYERLTAAVREKLRAVLAARLPEDTGAAVRMSRAGNVRALLCAESGFLLSVCPCVLSSPEAVARFLPPEERFDLVIFDEASQLTTAEAIGSLARARAAIVAGDPNQLPPSSFFSAACSFSSATGYASVLDDCLCAGMPEVFLGIHYRSKHESLIAFSNQQFYGGRLLTLPSPDTAMRVKLVETAGVYERGGSKRNRAEARAVADEALRRLSDPECRSSIGIVTFSGAQQEEIGRLLALKLPNGGVSGTPHDSQDPHDPQDPQEPLFIKNLENVQGDERDVILLSVCYGPDADGKLTLNFGPLNRADGPRRLNVAVSRAREEMIVFSSLRAADLRADSRGGANLKALLEFAEHGTYAPHSASGRGVGRAIARELKRRGYTCRVGVGASSYRIEVAVVDPRDDTRFLMAILSDEDGLSVKDRSVLLPGLLRRAGWNVMTVSCVGFYRNPEREIARIKRELDALTGRRERARAERRARRYRAVPPSDVCGAEFFLREENADRVKERLREIVAREQPISRAFLKKRCLMSFRTVHAGARTLAALDRLIDACKFPRDRVCGIDYLYADRRALGFEKYRTEGTRTMRREAEDFTVYEVVAFARGALEDGVALYADELAERFSAACGANAETLRGFVEQCVDYGVEKGILKRSPSERISLA